MLREITSKNLDGITDLVVVAPIREGFIQAYENVTYAARLQIVAEALHRIRQSAREHEFTVPFSDTTERILTLLDFRVGVLDQDLFNLDPTHGPKARRYLYLTATFDGAWEPYMRLIWKPLGPFLDLLFCNCEGYVIAGDNDFPQYAQWVRDHQLDSSIFYSTTGFTIRDQLYLGRLDSLTREAADNLAVTRATMPDPEEAAKNLRAAAVAEASTNPTALIALHELALEALTVLFKLADYYPPEWLIATDSGQLRNEGVYLARVAESLLRGWPLDRLSPGARRAYKEPLDWYESAILPDADNRRVIDSRMPHYDDPAFADRRSDVQSGMLRPQGSDARPVRTGALLLMTITDAAQARAFVSGQLDFHFEGDAMDGDNGLFRTIAFTAEGLRRIGVHPETVQQFPREFRDGMAMRSGLIGDVRENHPRRWIPPERNWPPRRDKAELPPLDLTEVDFVVQLRHAPASAAEDSAAAIFDEIDRIASLAVGSGAVLAGYVPMASNYRVDGAGKEFVEDHFGFRDGISQPDILDRPVDKVPNPIAQVRLGELLCGYRNDREDFATPDEYFSVPPANFDAVETARWKDQCWRRERRRKAAGLQQDGSFLVVRKLEQHIEDYQEFLQAESERVSHHYGVVLTPDALAARLLGRHPDGQPLLSTKAGKQNDFDYEGDKEGQGCPFAAHVRRANPRSEFQERPTPRIVRRGMSYHNDDTGERGLIFQCYNASIAEQYEVIQRWINGGNSTGVSSAQNDPLMGVGPKRGDRLFRFEWEGRAVSVRMPKRFVTLHWGLYLFVPSRSAIAQLCDTPGSFNDFDEALETLGRARINLVQALPLEQRRAEWKRLLEDFYAKDPAELNQMPDIWSAIRWYGGGSWRVDLNPTMTFSEKSEDSAAAFLGGAHAPAAAGEAPSIPEPTVLTASHDHAMRVLADWKTFSVEGQLSRIVRTSGSIYVTQQPDDVYDDTSLAAHSNYREESGCTNTILLGYDEASGFETGYAAGKAILDAAWARAQTLPVPAVRDHIKLELRRQFLMPALGKVCAAWFGLPDGKIMINGGWNWNKATENADPASPSCRPAQCPGDCLSPSRDAFYPNPTPTISMFAHDHGPAIRKAGQAFVDKYIKAGERPPGSFAGAMFDLQQNDQLTTEGYARNLIGIMVGAMPPMDGNLRGILLEWINQKTLWRHQGAYLRERAEPGTSRYEAARGALYSPMVRAMCKRPAPDLIYRKARRDVTLPAAPHSRKVGGQDVQVKRGDKIVVSLVSVAQRALAKEDVSDSDKVSIIFGGNREKSWQGAYDDKGELVDPTLPVHACPAQKLAMGAMMGILAALLEAGDIRALPAALILQINAPRPS